MLLKDVLFHFILPSNFRQEKNNRSISSSWKANSFSTNPEIFMLSILNVLYHVNDSLPRDRSPSQINPVHIFTRHFFILRFGLIYHSHLGLTNDICSSGTQTNTLYAILISPRGAPCPINLILLDFNTLKLFGEAPLGEVFSSLSSLPSSCPYPEAVESSPHFDILFHLDPF